MFLGGSAAVEQREPTLLLSAVVDVVDDRRRQVDAEGRRGGQSGQAGRVAGQHRDVDEGAVRQVEVGVGGLRLRPHGAVALELGASPHSSWAGTGEGTRR